MIKIAVYCNFELLGKSVTKSMPTISHGYSGTPRGDKEAETWRVGFARLQTTQFEQCFCNQMIYVPIKNVSTNLPIDAANLDVQHYDGIY